MHLHVDRSLSPRSSARPSSAMINTRVYIRARAPRLQLRPVVREETRVDGEREKGSGREEEEEEEANRWIERTVCARVEARSRREKERVRQRGRSKEEHTRSGPEKRNDKAARSAARWFGLTAVKKGKERREKVEVCCAAVGTDCRASEQLALLSFSFYRSGRRACRLSLYRSGRAAPVASPSVVFTLSLYRAPERTSPILLLPSLSLSHSSSSLASARKRTGLGRVSFPPSLPPSLSGISSPDRLYRPVDFSSAFRDRASRWSSAIAATGAHAYVHIHTPYPPRRIVPAENRAFFRTPGRDSSPISFQSPVIN